MAIFAIGDLHLAKSMPKPMDIFRGWDGYMERLEENWCTQICENDTIVIAGDISWAMKLEETVADFQFLESLPGTKLLMKGNHDYWWNTRKKIESFFAQNNFRSLQMLHNSAVTVDGKALCGSRGWIFENGAPHDRRIVEREAGRIQMSLEAADPEAEKILFLHYPPIYHDLEITDFFDLMEKYHVTHCYYGHLHGAALSGAFKGIYKGVELAPISADYLKFAPVKLF